MNTANHITADDLYLFALQLLPDADMKDGATHLKECAVCRAQLGQIQGDLVTYALTTDLQTPPSQARERLLRQVADEKKVIPINPADPASPANPLDRQIEPVLYPRNSRMFQMDAPEEREPQRFAPLMAWIGWILAACLAGVAGMQVAQRKTVEQDLAVETSQLSQSMAQSERAQEVEQTLLDTNAMQVALHVPLSSGAAPKLDPEAHATYVPETGALVFGADHLDPLETGKIYELWLMPAQAGQTPISAGLFKPDANGNAVLVMPDLPKGVAAKGFGVTVEQDGGSKTPTAPIVLAGM